MIVHTLIIVKLVVLPLVWLVHHVSGVRRIVEVRGVGVDRVHGVPVGLMSLAIIASSVLVHLLMVFVVDVMAAALAAVTVAMILRHESVALTAPAAMITAVRSTFCALHLVLNVLLLHLVLVVDVLHLLCQQNLDLPLLLHECFEVLLRRRGGVDLGDVHAWQCVKIVEVAHKELIAPLFLHLVVADLVQALDDAGDELQLIVP